MKSILLSLLLIFAFSCFTLSLYADTTDASVNDLLTSLEDTKSEAIKEIKEQKNETTPSLSLKRLPLTEPEFRFNLLVGLFITTPLFLFILLYFLKQTKDCTSDNVFSAAGLVLVIHGTLFIILATVNDQALTAAIGVIGAIAGYLFGSQSAKSRTTKEDHSQNKNS